MSAHIHPCRILPAPDRPPGLRPFPPGSGPAGRVATEQQQARLGWPGAAPGCAGLAGRWRAPGEAGGVDSRAGRSEGAGGPLAASGGPMEAGRAPADPGGLLRPAALAGSARDRGRSGAK